MQFDWKEGYLLATVDGEYSMAYAREALSQVLDALGERGIERALVDGRELTGSPVAMERFDFGEFSAAATGAFTRRHPGRPAPRIAFVLRTPVLDPERLAETVAVNRGADCRMFDDADAALRWLLAAPGHGPA